jgi:hypothetical protein
VAEALDDLFVGSGASGGGAPTFPRVTVGPVHLDRRDDHLVTAVPFTVEHAPSSHGTTVDAVAHRASHDGWIADRSEPPTTAWTEVVGFSPTSDAEDLVVEGSRLVVTGDDARDWHAIVRSRAGIAVALDLTPQPVEASA